MNSLQLLPAAGERLDRLCNLNTGTHFSLIPMPTGCLILSFSSLNDFAKINNIAQASGRLLGKVTRKMFLKLPSTIMEEKWHNFFAHEVLLGYFKDHTLNYFSEAFRVSFWTK